MITTSFIELKKSALESNIKFLQKTIGSKCKMSSVVKGNAYGHGVGVFVPIALECGIDHFSVFSTEEAFEVKKCTNSNADIMIMGMVDNEDITWAIENDIEFYIFDLERLNATLAKSKKLGKPARIHLEVETGMNRTGLTKEELKSAKIKIQNNSDNFVLKGFCTHYAGAESIANFHRVKNQIKTFRKFSRWMDRNNMKTEMNHTACSAAVMTYPESRMDMVRIGIMQYGFWPSKETLINYLSKESDKTDPLKRILSWKSKVMSIKSVPEGEFIGYGTTYMAENDMVIATVPVGYSHGYSRSLSNQGRVLINNTRVSVIGMVNMSMLIVDISNVQKTKPGDEVVLIGNQGDLSITVASFSELSVQLNYELLTRLPPSIPRVITI